MHILKDDMVIYGLKVMHCVALMVPLVEKVNRYGVLSVNVWAQGCKEYQWQCLVQSHNPCQLRISQYHTMPALIL